VDEVAREGRGGEEGEIGPRPDRVLNVVPDDQEEVEVAGEMDEPPVEKERGDWREPPLVTIPKALRDRLGIRPGQVLDFAAENGRLVATKATGRDPVDSVYGILGRKRSSDALIRVLRGPADAL
jgi:antitoxin component of MazEF toxin-antitoxin module